MSPSENPVTHTFPAGSSFRSSARCGCAPDHHSVRPLLVALGIITHRAVIKVRVAAGRAGTGDKDLAGLVDRDGLRLDKFAGQLGRVAAHNCCPAGLYFTVANIVLG